MSAAVVKAQGCRTTDPPTPTAEEPLTTPEPAATRSLEPPPSTATPDVGRRPDAGTADLGAQADPPDAGPPPIRVMPATKSGGFWQYEDKPQKQQAAPQKAPEPR